MSSSCTSGSRRMSREALLTSLPRMLPGCAARLRCSACERGRVGAAGLMGRQQSTRRRSGGREVGRGTHLSATILSAQYASSRPAEAARQTMHS